MSERHGDTDRTRRARLPRRAWWQAARRTLRQFQQDNLGDRAAALTYYGVLSLFPGLLLLVTLLRLAGAGTLSAAVDSVSRAAPGPAAELLRTALRGLVASGTGTAGVLAVVSLVAALWSASGYLGAFIRAANAIYDVPEGRPIWKTLPLRVGLTIGTGVLIVASVLIVVLTGRVAQWVGDLLGFGPAAVTAWSIAKWPVLVLLVGLLFALLYWAAPNARHGGLRLVGPGGLLAVLIWVLASAGFALYVKNFGAYDKTYGSLAGVIIFLVWLWISNLALLLGAEFDAELERGRAILAGHPSGQEPYLELRDTRSLSDAQRAQVAAGAAASPDPPPAADAHPAGSGG